MLIVGKKIEYATRHFSPDNLLDRMVDVVVLIESPGHWSLTV